MKINIPALIAALVMISSAHAQTPPDGPRQPNPEMQAAREAMMKACADAKPCAVIKKVARA